MKGSRWEGMKVEGKWHKELGERRDEEIQGVLTHPNMIIKINHTFGHLSFFSIELPTQRQEI